jgi:DNA uptake protein ComE-like DNA-binding protein
LFGIIIALQIGYYCIDFKKENKPSLEEQKWMSLQNDSIIVNEEKLQFERKIYPFNPNFITDSKGYKLGMSAKQIDKLLAFRKQGLFVNSKEEFQKVTGVSDSLLQIIAPYFKFPDWVTNKSDYGHKKNNSKWIEYPKKDPIKIIDINNATKEDLIKISGIGEAISERILKQKELLGAFVSMDQMKDIWGLTPEVIDKLDQSFTISTKPMPVKININDASIKELEKFPYFRYPISKNIVTYRSMNGEIKIDDLSKIKGFPVDKIKIIALYLNF